MTKSKPMLTKEFTKDLSQYFSSSFMWLREKLKSPNLNVFVSQRLLEIEREDKAELCEADRTLFDLPDPGDQKIPSTEHRQALVELFEFLGNRRRTSWKNLNDSKKEKAAYDHALTEVAALRTEIIDLKSLITTSERVMAAWMIGAVLFFTKDIIPTVWILVLPLLFSLFGLIRFREFQRNVFTLDCYLRELEVALRPDGGWVSYFFKTRRMELFFETRQYFWKAAVVASVSILVLGLLGIIEPKPFEVRVLE